MQCICVRICSTSPAQSIRGVETHLPAHSYDRVKVREIEGVLTDAADGLLGDHSSCLPRIGGCQSQAGYPYQPTNGPTQVRCNVKHIVAVM